MERDDAPDAVRDGAVEGLEGKHLTFRLGGEVFGLPIADVIEIVGILPVTDLPEVPAWIRGVVNLRGRVIPVMDVRRRFGMEPRPDDDRTCIVVASLGEESVGLIVDAVSEVLDIDAERITPTPPVGTSAANDYLRGLGMVGERVVVLLDTARLLQGDARRSLAEAPV